MNHKPTLSSYVIGFSLSIFITLVAFTLTFLHSNSSYESIPQGILIPVLLGLALVQLVVQLIFFLHLLQEEKPRWNLLFFISTIGIIFLVVVGSIWIMGHLNHNMTPQQMEQYTQSQDGF